MYVLTIQTQTNDIIFARFTSKLAAALAYKAALRSAVSVTVERED